MYNLYLVNRKTDELVLFGSSDSLDECIAVVNDVRFNNSIICKIYTVDDSKYTQSDYIRKKE